ncbi:MAG TPA: peroxiredoxin [Candidatus Bathyarchaeia archaeon]|nr:peroxiredoxin [Candidatus Bathyarchaeia archaeon]
MIRVGSPAPDFRLRTRDGSIVSLEEFRGKKNVVVYFYPKDFTRGCTAEACEFRDYYEQFKTLGAEVIGISGDSEQSHDSFAREHSLPFILLSDPDGLVRKAFEVKKSLGLIPGRVTFVIDKQGILRHIFSSQARATAHTAEALAVLKSLS